MTVQFIKGMEEHFEDISTMLDEKEKLKIIESQLKGQGL